MIIPSYLLSVAVTVSSTVCLSALNFASISALYALSVAEMPNCFIIRFPKSLSRSDTVVLKNQLYNSSGFDTSAAGGGVVDGGDAAADGGGVVDGGAGGAGAGGRGDVAAAAAGGADGAGAGVGVVDGDAPSCRGEFSGESSSSESAVPNMLASM